VRRIISSNGGAPIYASSDDGRGTEENCVMGDGQTLLMRISISCEEVAADRMAASDVDLMLDLVRVFERSRSVVWELKYGDENPCNFV
jgi:hypothetical protein